MRLALVGFPQSGKSTLFRLLCGPHAHTETYGAHLGVARLADPRLDRLAALYHPKKTTPVSFEFLDAPALVDRPEKDTTVFGQVRGADAFLHVLRLFGDDADPARDAGELETEFLFLDLDTVSKRQDKVAHDLQKAKTAALELERAVLENVRAALEKDQPLRALALTPEEERCLRGFQLLSAKPLLLVVSASEDHATKLESLGEELGLAEFARRPRVALASICAQLEAELAELDPDEAATFMDSYGLKGSARETVLRAAFDLLGLITFFTVSQPECRAWAGPRGLVAVEAAGMVHSDFARRFIKAEVIPWDALVACGSLAAAREQGRVRLEGKDHPVAEGDVLYIRHTA